MLRAAPGLRIEVQLGCGWGTEATEKPLPHVFLPKVKAGPEEIHSLVLARAGHILSNQSQAGNEMATICLDQ